MDQRLGGLARLVRDVPDFPKPGILFKDITPLVADADAFRTATELMAAEVPAGSADVIVGIESRGFIFGSTLAQRLGLGFVPVRKPNKLPWRKRRVTYDTEYSTDALEMHEDALAPGARVVVVDDLLATGGTAAATARLVEEQGARVQSLLFVVELDFLSGRRQLGDRAIHSLIHF